MAFVIFVAYSLLRDMDMHKITKYMQWSHNLESQFWWQKCHVVFPYLDSICSQDPIYAKELESFS